MEARQNIKSSTMGRKMSYELDGKSPNRVIQYGGWALAPPHKTLATPIKACPPPSTKSCVFPHEAIGPPILNFSDVIHTHFHFHKKNMYLANSGLKKDQFLAK